MKELLDLLKVYIEKNDLLGLTYIRIYDDESGSICEDNAFNDTEDIFDFNSIEELKEELLK